MVLSIISFTENGMALSEKIARTVGETDTIKEFDIIEEFLTIEVRQFTKCTTCFADGQEFSIQFVKNSIGDWAKEQMEDRNVLFFIGACGIAVRAIAPCLTDKLHDSPVLVADEKGQYLIPILSGHVGGANALASWIAEKIGAEPVITTATDLNRKFAVDLFAKKNGLFIVNRDGIAKVSAKVLSGQTISMSVETGHLEVHGKQPDGIHILPYPPAQQVDVMVTSEEKEWDAAILLKPREYVIGMGCRRGKEAEQIDDFIRRHLEKFGIVPGQVVELASIDRKRNEPGLLAWSRKERIPFRTYTAEELQSVKGTFQTSDFVQNQVGVDNVCERAALKSCEPMGTLVYEKHAENGMTIAIAKREWKVKFGEI